MLVHLPKNRLRKGMFIELVECESHEFDKRRFLLVQDTDLQAIAESSAEFVLINIALGIDDKGHPPTSSCALAASLGADPRSVAKIQQKIDHASTVLKTNLATIVSGTMPDIGAMTSIVQTMTSTWCAAPAIAMEMTRLKTKDEATYTHSLAVGTMMSLLGHSVKLDEETNSLLGVAGILHDIGKLLIPKEILTKPGQLTEEGRAVIRRHPEEGYQLLKAYPNISTTILDICRLHHEALDGSGYPLGLKANELDLPVRISTVCDVFEALTSTRPYKRSWPMNEALSWMFARPQLFDRKLVVRLSDSLGTA